MADVASPRVSSASRTACNPFDSVGNEFSPNSPLEIQFTPALQESQVRSSLQLIIPLIYSQGCSYRVFLKFTPHFSFLFTCFVCSIKITILSSFFSICNCLFCTFLVACEVLVESRKPD